MKNRLSAPYLTNLDLPTLNRAFIDLYRDLNRISDSADEISYIKREDGARELTIQDGDKNYSDSSKASFTEKNIDIVPSQQKESSVFNHLRITGTLDGGGANNNQILIKEDASLGSDVLSGMLKFDGSTRSLTTNVSIFGGINTDTDVMKFICGAPTGQDTYYSLWRSFSQEWKVGNDDTVNSVADTNTFKIEAGTGTSFSDTSEFMLDTSGNATIKGDLTVSGGDATLTAANDTAASILMQADNSDDAGDDWKIIANADQTFTIGNDKASAGSYVSMLTVTPHATASSSRVAIAGILTADTVTNTHSINVQTHAFYISGTSEVYLPFGPSAIEGSSTADSANDDTLFIAPYAGSLEFVKIQCATGGGTIAGATRMELRVNGTDGGYVQATISNEVTQTFTWSTDNTFSAGDRLRITFDTSAAAKYVSATSVWKYTL